LHTDPSLYVHIITALFAISVAVAITVKWVKVPYAVALVIVGLLIGVFNWLPAMRMTPDLILLVFLPALLFEASWNLDLSQLKQNWLVIVSLASIGVVVSMLIIGFILHLGAAVPWPVALLFGSMISATDPVSVMAILRQIGINKRLSAILEGESLFNDGTAVVLFQLMLSVAVSGAAFSLPTMLTDFLVEVLGGGALGLAVGYVASKVISYFDDYLLELMLTTVVAYGSFFLGIELHLSPVLAVVAAGIVAGNYARKSAMTESTRIAVDSFWAYAAFAVNSIVFLLIGMQVHLPTLMKYVPEIVCAIVAVLVSRLIVVYCLCPLLSSKNLPIPFSWNHLLFWGALRGSLCMAMALSLPDEFALREHVTVVVFGVVLFTLIVQGLTIEPLIKLLSGKDADLLSESHG
jgi:CPA1 family monovalent cation:H+ antiporter